MSHRRSHTKSRHGCLQCKKNRTKCDEERPSCARCVRTGKTCSLLNPDSALILIPDSRSKTISEGSRDLTEPAVEADAPSRFSSSHDSRESKQAEQNETSIEARFTTADINRLRLMNHYARTVADSIANFTLATENGLSIWRVEVPRLALEHEFLLHGLLAVSSLHLATSDPSCEDKYNSLAIQHYGHGVTLFRPQLVNMTSKNIDAFFAFSCIISLYSFRIHRTGLSQLNSLAKIHEAMTVIRGASVIVASGTKWLREGIWAPTLLIGSVETPGRLSNDMEDVLDELSRRIRSTITTSSNTKLYSAAIEILRKTFWVATTRPHTQLTIVLFPIMVQPEFLTMMCISEPLALAILANYAVILYWQRKQIWVEGWGKETVEAVRQALPPDWYPCISWAVQEVTG